MALTAMWTHGHTLVATNQNNVQISSLGSGALIRAPQQSEDPEWIHYAIPTPVFLNGKRPQIIRVMILFNTLNEVNQGTVSNGLLNNVHVWDRDRNILALNNLELAGNHLELSDSNKFNFSQAVTPLFGIGVSIGYQFDPNHRDTSLLITSVGADFQF